MAVDLKKYDFPQVLRSVFDDDANTLRVSVVSGGGGGGTMEVLVNHVDDSIRLGDGTTLFTGSTVGPKTGLDVNIISGTVTANLGSLNGAATSANQTTSNTTLSSILTELQQKTEPTDTQPVSVTSLPLPTGASTSALQTTGNSSLASIDTKLTSPLTVQSTDLDIRNLTFLSDKVDASGSSVSVSNFPATQAVSGTVEIGATSLAALESITVQNAAGASAVNIQDGGNSITVDGTVNVGNFPATQNVNVTNSSIAVTGPLTNTELRASAVPVSLASTTITSSALPTGASTAANQTTSNTTLSSIDAKTPALGQTTMAASSPVTIASNQSALPVTGAFFQATQPVSAASLPLPTGAATSALQTTANASLTSIDTKLTAPLLVKANFLNDYTTTSIGALRVAISQNVFESLFSFDKQPLIWDEVLTSGGTSTFNTNTNSVDMTLPTTSGAEVVRQTFRRIRYNPSRTVQILTAGNIGLPKANVRKRIGQFDTLDGLFFEHDGLTVNVVIRSAVSGAAVDTKISQANWNIDKFDGTGVSGITIDFSKHQLFYIQYAFQGFGDVVFGFYHDGGVKFCHREKTANVLTTPFMRTAHLPCRTEITNTGTSASPTTMSYNSVTVKNEGEDADEEGQVRSYSLGPVKAINTTVVPIISVRLDAARLRAVADLMATTIYVQTADEVIWTLWVNATLTGATFAVPASYTVVDTAATAMSGGTELISGILSQGSNSTSVSKEYLKLINSLLGVSLSGTPSIITLGARSRVGAADVSSTLVWREYP